MYPLDRYVYIEKIDSKIKWEIREDTYLPRVEEKKLAYLYLLIIILK